MKKRYFGLLPIVASLSLVAGGFASWIFSVAGNTSTTAGLDVITTTADGEISKLGKFTVTNSDYNLDLDQVATTDNSTGKGANFTGSLSIVWTFAADDATADEKTYTNVNKFNYEFSIKFTVNSTLYSYVDLSFSGTTLSADNNTKTTTISTSTTTITSSNAEQTLFNSASTDSNKLTASYNTTTFKNASSITETEYDSMKSAITAIDDYSTSLITIEVTAKASLRS